MYRFFSSCGCMFIQEGYSLTNDYNITCKFKQTDEILRGFIKEH